MESLWPIFRIHHQKTRYIFDLFYKRKAISRGNGLTSLLAFPASNLSNGSYSCNLSKCHDFSYQCKRERGQCWLNTL